MKKNVIQGSLITTYRCNAKCNMCNIWKNPSTASEEVPADIYNRLPDGLRINITGGEATIRTDIEQIFENLYDRSSLLLNKTAMPILLCHAVKTLISRSVCMRYSGDSAPRRIIRIFNDFQPLTGDGFLSVNGFLVFDNLKLNALCLHC